MKKVVLLLSLVLIAGCSSTELHTYTDSSFLGHQYSRLMVDTPHLGLYGQDLLQGKICQAVRDDNTSCMRSIDVFAPTRSYTNKERKALLDRIGIQAIIVVLPRAYSVSYRSISDYNYWTTPDSDNRSEESSSNRRQPLVSKRVTQRLSGYKVLLIDERTGKVAWIGETHSAGPVASDSESAESLAESVAEHLHGAGFI